VLFFARNMKSLLKTFERHVDGRTAATQGRRNARYDVRIELVQSTQATSIPRESAREEAHRAMPDGSDQFGGISRRSARELGADAAAGGTDDFRALERGAYDEYGLTDNNRLRR
jgi:hypothetical protein